MPVVRSSCRCLAVGLMIGLWAAIGYWCLPTTPEAAFDGIHIRGDNDFIKRVETSLALLRDKSPEAFALTQQYVKRIQKRRRSGMRAYADPPTFDLSARSACHSVTWCAGVIAHDMYHSKLYHEYRHAHGEPVPDDAWCGQMRELECIDYQLRVLQQIGAPQYEIAHVSEQDGTHYDIDGDGQFTWRDYWKRDW